MTTLARAVYGLLVVATLAAFFVTQRLKHSPTVVQRIQMTPAFSPTGRGGLHREHVSFRIKQSDDVTVTVVDARGEDVATLTHARHVPAYTQLSLRWDGTTDAGSPAPAGIYRVRFRLGDQRRTVLSARSFRLSSRGPRPTVTLSGPASSPLILPQTSHVAVVIHIHLGGGTDPVLTVYRTDVAPSVAVTRVPVPRGATTVAWDPRVRGRSLAPGTYLVAVSDHDAAGNEGSSPPDLPPTAVNGATVAGHAGFTVRYVGLVPPVNPVAAGTLARFGVDTRHVPYTYSVARVGAGRPSETGKGNQPVLGLRAPAGVSGLYTLSVRAGAHASEVPFAVQGPGRRSVLVVLPAITWLGQDPLDDNGDGLPDSLDAVRPVSRQRVLAGGLPHGFAGEASVLAFLDRHHLRYDLTTDIAQAASAGAGLRGYRGILLAGDERWSTLGLAHALTDYVASGGRVVSLGTDSLRRTVTLTPDTLTEPGPAGPTDVFGARIRPVVHHATHLLSRTDHGLALFSGGSGSVPAVPAYEPTIDVGPRAQVLSSAMTRSGQMVIVAARYGRGLVVRTGIPELAQRLGTDLNAAALMGRMWQLLSR